MNKKHDNKEEVPYTCTPEYDRSACGSCVCATCYEQEQSRKKESCSRYEGAYCY